MRIHWPILAAALWVATPAWPDDARDPDSALGRATQRLEAAQAAERQASEELALLRASGRASADELSELEAFLEGLRRMVESQRLELERIRSAARWDAVGASRSELDRRRLDVEPALTDVERVSGLDRQLDASLGDFDEMLLREQDKLAAKTRSASTTGAASGSAGATGESAEREAQGASGSESPRDGAPGEGEQTAATTYPYDPPAGSGDMRPLPPVDAEGRGEPGDVRVAASADERRGARGGAAIPPDIPDGKDDDVVARQLREAAQNETDPVLREKLWDEYRKYKSAGR